LIEGNLSNKIDVNVVKAGVNHNIFIEEKIMSIHFGKELLRILVDYNFIGTQSHIQNLTIDMWNSTTPKITVEMLGIIV